jgi:hypothetical protein
MAAVALAWWSLLQPKNKQPARTDAGVAGAPQDVKARGPRKEPGMLGQDEQDIWVVLQIDVPPPELFASRLDELERTLSHAQRMRAAGAPVEPIVLSLLHEEIRYVRVMLSMSQEVAQKRGRL